MNRSIYLTFDLEEFDMPLEYGHTISVDEQMRIGKAGMIVLSELLKAIPITATFFVTGNFASHYPNIVKEIANNHEIGSHSYYHTGYTRGDLKRSKQIIEDIIKKRIHGLRMPRMRILEAQEILEAGFTYDASVNPTYLPNRYNNLLLPVHPYEDNSLLRIPASVVPGIRIPLFWLSFKNFPFHLYKTLCKRTLRKNDSLVLYFHPWEFTDVTHYGLPDYTCKPYGKELLDRLKRLMEVLSKEGEFKTMENHLQ